MKELRQWVPVRRIVASGVKIQRIWLKYLCSEGLLEDDWDIYNQSCEISTHTTIGQMIKFLKDETTDNLAIKDVGDGWIVEHGSNLIKDVELRYALWEMVLKVLRKKNYICPTCQRQVRA